MYVEERNMTQCPDKQGFASGRTGGRKKER